MNKDLYRRIAKDNGVRYPATLGREDLAHERAFEYDNALIDKINGQLRWGGRTVALDDERQVMTLPMATGPEYANRKILALKAMLRDGDITEADFKRLKAGIISRVVS